MSTPKLKPTETEDSRERLITSPTRRANLDQVPGTFRFPFAAFKRRKPPPTSYGLRARCRRHRRGHAPQRPSNGVILRSKLRGCRLAKEKQAWGYRDLQISNTSCLADGAISS